MRLFDFLFERERKCPDESKPDKGATVPSRRVYVNTGERAMQIGAFFHAVRLRGTTAARAVLRFERMTVSGRWQEFSKGSQEYRHLNWLLQVRPNDRMTALQMWKKVYRDRDLTGCAGILIRRKAELVESLIPVTLSYDNLNNVYTATSDDYGTSWTAVRPEDLIVLKGESLPGSCHCRSMRHYMQQTLSLAATAEAMCLDVTSKGGTFKAIVKQEDQLGTLQGLGHLNDTEMKKNTDTLSDQFAEGKDFLYDPSAASITPITQSFQDLQVDLQRSRAVEDIARFMGVPLPLMFYSTNAVYKSIDDAWHTFKTLTVEPMLEEVEQEMNAKLLNEHDFGKFRFSFDTRCLCLDTDKGKAETAQIYRNAGIKTANEIREDLGLAPLPESSTEPQPQPAQGGGNANGKEGEE